MGATNKATWTWKGTSGDKAKTVVMEVTDEAAADTLRTALVALSDGAIVSQSYSALDNYDAVPTDPSNTDRRAVCYYQDVDDNSLLRVTIPAIKAAHTEMKTEGERVKAASMSTIQGLLETATGRDLRPLYGVVVQKS